jgi:Zn-dependent protease with chaperone function
MFFKIKNKEVAIKEIKSTLAHELAHIYHKHSLYQTILSQIQKYHHVVYCLFFSLSCFSLFLLLSSFMLPSIAVSIPMIAESVIGFSIFTILFKSIEVLSKLANHVVQRAHETQADLKACEISNPTDAYLYHMLSEYLLEEGYVEKLTKEKDNDGTFSFFPPVVHNVFRKKLKGYLDSHPNDTQRKLDIKLFFPEAANAEEKYTKRHLKNKAIRKAL